MNTSHTENTSRPLGFWITAVDRLVANAFADAFRSEGLTRRDWRMLTIVSGDTPARRPLTGRRLGHLLERGWVTPDGSGWMLTDSGRGAKDRLGGIVDGIRATVDGAVSAEDLAATAASLERIARAFGWEEGTPLPHRHAREHRGFGSRFGGRHGHRPGFGPHGEHPFAGHHDHHSPAGDAPCGRGGMGGHRGHPREWVAAAAQHAYERGFDTGFERARAGR